MDPLLAATPYLLMPDLEGTVGVDRPSAGLLAGDLVGIIGVTTFAPEKEKGWIVVEFEGINGTGEEMTGVAVIGVVMGRVEGEESVGEGMMWVGVMVDVTWMGLVEEDWRERLWLLAKLSGAMRESEEEVTMELGDV